VIPLFRTELLKLMTTRMVYALLGALLSIVAIANVIVILTAPEAELMGEENQSGLFGAAASGIIFVLLLGVMMMAGEFRHGTITQTLLITPNRWKVLAAKLAAGGVLGFAFGLIAELFSFVIGVPLLTLTGIDLALGSESADLVLGTVLTTTLCAMLGVALGTMIRNQVAAIILVFALLLIVEPLVTASIEGRWPEIPKYFPGHGISSTLDPEGEGNIFSRPGGAAVLLGYIAVLAGVGGRFVLSRDVNSIQA
jgi:ABC-2 type transport system permease protein